MPLILVSMVFSCEDDNKKPACVSGVIVGEKCTIIALQLDVKSHGAKAWGKKDVEGTITYYENVIGILNLEPGQNKIGQRIYLIMREATMEERNVGCYADLPGPPQPVYVIITESGSACQ